MMMKTRSLFLLGTFFVLTARLSAAPPTAVLDALRSPLTGVEPILLYTSSAEINEGAGDPRWIAAEGTLLSALGLDPWGDEGGAFGPPLDAISGAGISDSIESPLLIGETGALLLCVYLPDVIGDPAMILSRGTWGNQSAFDLRATKAPEIILYATAPDETGTTTFSLGRFVPGRWYFVALAWQKEDDHLNLDTFVGEIFQGQRAETRSFSIAGAGDPSAPVLIAGRINPNLSSVVLHEGLLSCVAIYEAYLPPEKLEELFDLICAEAKP